MYLRLDLVYTQGSQVPDGCLVFTAGTADIVELSCWFPDTDKSQSMSFIRGLRERRRKTQKGVISPIGDLKSTIWDIYIIGDWGFVPLLSLPDSNIPNLKLGI